MSAFELNTRALVKYMTVKNFLSHLSKKFISVTTARYKFKFPSTQLYLCSVLCMCVYINICVIQHNTHDNIRNNIIFDKVISILRIPIFIQLIPNQSYIDTFFSFMYFSAKKTIIKTDKK